MGAGNRVVEDDGSSGRRKTAAGAAGTCLADNTPGAGPGYYLGQECLKGKDEAECWPGEPGDQWGWTFLPSRLEIGDHRRFQALNSSQELSFERLKTEKRYRRG